jgi:hypothetical protein
VLQRDVVRCGGAAAFETEIALIASTAPRRDAYLPETVTEADEALDLVATAGHVADVEEGAMTELDQMPGSGERRLAVIGDDPRDATSVWSKKSETIGIAASNSVRSHVAGTALWTTRAASGDATGKDANAKKYAQDPLAYGASDQVAAAFALAGSIGSKGGSGWRD